MKKRSKKWLFEKNNQLRKLFKIMRLSVILLFIGMHLTFANVGAQSKVTIEHQFVTYQELFSQIQKQTGLTVVYSNNGIKIRKYKPDLYKWSWKMCWTRFWLELIWGMNLWMNL